MFRYISRASWNVLSVIRRPSLLETLYFLTLCTSVSYLLRTERFPPSHAERARIDSMRAVSSNGSIRLIRAAAPFVELCSKRQLGL